MQLVKSPGGTKQHEMHLRATLQTGHHWDLPCGTIINDVTIMTMQMTMTPQSFPEHQPFLILGGQCFSFTDKENKTSNLLKFTQ